MSSSAVTVSDDQSQQPRMVLHYRGGATKLGLITTAVLSPLWLGWSLYVASGLATTIILGGIVGYWDLAILFCFYMALVAVGALTVYVCLNNKLIVTSTGLEAPMHYLLQMAFNRSRSWKELREVQFRDNNIRLMFDTLGDLTLSQNGFNASELKDFCIAIKANAPEAEFTFDHEALQKGIAGMKATKSGGFTATWEEDLSSRFGTTAYVPLEAGATLQNGRLTVIGQVSFGGLSAVYLCRTPNGETTILKEAVVPLNSDQAAKAKALEMFEREARLLKSLKHPNIARVLDHFVEKHHNYLLLQHIEGPDLRQYIKDNGPQTERIIMRWDLEIAEVLTYLHDHEPPIVHRDLTPDNLVLDKSGALKLIDFGAANELIGTATGTLVGKQAYISPEQFRGKATTCSDIYSLGCTLYYLATGADPEALAQSHLPEDVAQQMPVLAKLIANCTELEASDRLSSSRSIEETARHYLASAIEADSEE